jgi:hypothetical protein
MTNNQNNTANTTTTAESIESVQSQTQLLECLEKLDLILANQNQLKNILVTELNLQSGGENGNAAAVSRSIRA